EQAQRRHLELHRQPVEVQALRADRAVRVAAAGSEVVGADHRSAALDGAPAADVIRGRERRDAAFLVVRGEAGDTADFPERAFVEPRCDALPDGTHAEVAMANLTWVVSI